MVSEESLEAEIKEKLKSRIFLGTFEEKCFVPEINDYRNVVKLSTAETELSMELKDFSRRIKKIYKEPPCWFGFSTNDRSIVETTGSLFVDELEDIPFGHFWFQIRTVKFKREEIKVKLRVLRQVGETDFNSSKSSISSGNTTCSSVISSSNSGGAFSESIDWSEIFSSWADSTSKNVKDFLYYKVNRDNLRNAFHLFTLLVIGITVGTIEFVKYVGNFSIRFMTEFSRLIHVCTPIFFGILDLFSKIIGGFFIFLTMLWKDSIGGNRSGKQAAIRASPHNLQSIKYQPEYQRNFRSFQTKVQ